MTELNIFPITLALIILYPILRIIYNIYLHPLSAVPGPKIWGATHLPFVLALVSGRLTTKLEKLHHQYGPIVRIGPGDVIFTHPDAWNDILQPRPGHPQFLKDVIWWSESGPNGMHNAIDPGKHAQMRRMLAPGFTRSALLRVQEGVIKKYVGKLVQQLQERVRLSPHGNGVAAGVEIDIVPWTNFAAFDIMGDLAFGEPFNCLENSEYHPWIALVFGTVKAVALLTATRYFPLIDWVLRKCISGELKRKKEEHLQVVADKVQRRMNWEVEREDIMSYTLKGIDKDKGKGMSIDEINDTFVGITIAGSETTATTLGGILNYLSFNPEVRKRVEDEVRGRFEDLEQMTLVRVEECAYLTAVIREGLRICSPVPWVLPRVVPPEGATVCGTRLPARTHVSINPYTLNRSPSLFHNPNFFVPERWLDSDPKSPYRNDNLEAVRPFGVGPRSCIGQNLAWAELRLVLAGLLFSFDFAEREDGAFPWEKLKTYVLVEKRPLGIVVKERVV